MAKFNLTVDSFGITQTRSKHEDTNFIGLTWKPGSLGATTVFQPLGNVNNGTHSVNLSLSGIDINQDDSFVFNYIIVNAGSANSDEVRAALEAVGAAWANGGGPPAPPLTSADGIDTDYLVAQLNGIFRSTCDGIVAAEQNHLTYGQLPIAHQTPQPGTHSPSGCGNNSQYTVHWHIANALLMPDVTSQSPAQAAATLRSLGFTNVTESGTGMYLVGQTTDIGQAPGSYVDVGEKIILSLSKTPR